MGCVETVVVGHACVHVSKTDAQDSVSHGPKDWHGIACSVTVAMGTPMQLQGRVATSRLVQVGVGQKVHGVAPV